MPWVSEELCTACEICVNECPVGAISMDTGIASIDNSECIRCGVCHDVCPVEAVRHDGERIPEEVASNMVWVQRLLGHEYYADDMDKQREVIDRLRRYFTKNRKVVEQTLESLEQLHERQYADQSKQ